MDGMPIDEPVSEASRQSQIRLIEQMHVRQLADVILTGKQVTSKLTADLEAARGVLMDLGFGFAFERFDELVKEGADLARMKPREIARILREELQMQKIIVRNAGAFPEKLAKLERELGEAREDLSRQRQRIQTAENRAETLDASLKSARTAISQRDEKIRTLEGELNALKRLQAERKAPTEERLSGEKNQDGRQSVRGSAQDNEKKIEANVRQAAAVSSSAEAFDTWYAGWQKVQGYAVQSGIVVVLGDTGKCRVADVGALVQERCSASRSAYYRALDACVAAALVSDKKEQLPTGGRPTRVLVLTDKGQIAYQLETQRDARTSEYQELIKAHKSKEHLGLILQVHDELVRLGFTSDPNPSRLVVNEEKGRYFYPDIVAINGEDDYLYIEVEYGTKRKSKNAAKWENASVIGADTIWLVCNTSAALTTHKSDISFWARAQNKQIRFLGSTILDLKHAQSASEMWPQDTLFTPQER